MLAYDGSHILHTAIAYFKVVLVEKGVIFVLSKKMFRYELIIRKVLPMLVFTLLLKGGLYQIMLRLRFRLGRVPCLCFL